MAWSARKSGPACPQSGYRRQGYCVPFVRCSLIPRPALHPSFRHLRIAGPVTGCHSCCQHPVRAQSL
eukprot:1978894-Karenia_brevis.AAC.1